MFKTILVHVADDAAGEARVEVAANLAEWCDARLIGVALAAAPAPFVADGTVGLSGVWSEQYAAAEAAAEKAGREFLDRMQARGLTVERRVAGGFEDLAAESFATSARYADLSVLGGRDAQASRTMADSLVERALFDSGRPALLIPAKGWSGAIGTTPVVAWDGGAQAARAARDALPFLSGADKVRVLVAGEAAGRHGEEPGADVAAWMSRHDVNVEVEVLDLDGRSVAEVLTAAAQAAGADLLVMGGYGHSRLRETLFGGVTTSMIEAPQLPVFISR